MSGGSYDYLYLTTEDDLLDERIARNIRDMAQRLNRLYETHHSDAPAEAAVAMENLADYLDAVRTVATRRFQSLTDVMHAVEWLASFDWGPDQVIDACEKWRNGR